MSEPIAIAIADEREPSRLRSLRDRVATDPVARNSAAIMVTTVVTSGLGYIFWLIAARYFGAAVSGAGAGITSALQVTVTIASVGAGAAMVEWLPRSRNATEWRQRVTSGLVLAVVTAAIGGPVTVVLLGHVYPVLPQLREGAGAVLFCCAALFFAVGTVLDYVAISEKNSTALVVRNVVLTGLRIPLLFVPWLAFGGDGTHILSAWTIAAGLSMLVSLLCFRRSPIGRTLRPQFGRIREHTREMGASFVGQHLITVSAMLAGYLLPIMVIARLSAADNGYFYITWMLGSIFFMISPAISTSLFAEGATNPGQLPALVRRCVLFSGGLLVLPMLAYLFGGGLLLGLFGSDYIEQGRPLLILLTLSAIPDAVTNIAVAVLRATGRMRHAFALNVSMLGVCLVGSWLLLPQLGIIAVGACWLGCQMLGATYAIIRRRTVFRAPSSAVDPAVVGAGAQRR